MIGSASHAVDAAKKKLEETVITQDPLFAPWSDAFLGEPVLVRDLAKNPSYWIVPVMVQEKVIGFVRVLRTGQVGAVGAFYTDPSQIMSCPTVVTGIDAEEARQRAEEKIHSEKGEKASDPVLVHDGPPGREAWLVEVYKNGRPFRWIFVTPAFVYERPAGQQLDETLE
jgi:hypothetical protein